MSDAEGILNAASFSSGRAVIESVSIPTCVTKFEDEDKKKKKCVSTRGWCRYVVPRVTVLRGFLVDVPCHRDALPQHTNILWTVACERAAAPAVAQRA
jgi:hypothetical protein